MTWLVGGRAYGQQVVEPFPHFLHPGADLWEFLVNLSPLLIVGKLDLHINFLKLGVAQVASEGSKWGIQEEPIKLQRGRTLVTAATPE